MHKSDKDTKHAPAPKAPAPQETPAVQETATACSVCGQGGSLVGDIGPARWHVECATARPDVIAKVKARA